MQAFKNLKFQIFLVLLFILVSNRIHTQDSIFIYDTEPVEMVLLNNQLYLLSDSIQLDDPQNILSYEEGFWRHSSAVNADSLQSENWLRLSLYNASKVNKAITLVYPTVVDTLDVYQYVDGEFAHIASSGQSIPLKEREINSNAFMFTVHLLAGDTTHIYTRAVINDPDKRDWFLTQALDGSNYTLTRDFIQTSIQVFLMGLLLLFTLMGLFMYFVFKLKDLLYYAGLIFSLSLIGFIASGADSILFDNEVIFGSRLLETGSILGQSVFLFLFVLSQLELKSRKPHWYKVFSVVFIILILYLVINLFVDFDFFWISLVSSILTFLLPVILIMEGLIAKQANAKSLFLSLSLFLSTCILLLVAAQVKGQLNINYFYVFQIGILVFAASLFYHLFKNINGIQLDRIKAEVEKEQSDQLLFNVLPQEIAQELKDKGKSDARHLSSVSVLFTDFKGFTELSEKMEATSLIEELQYYFESFDHIMEEYGIEKIKTIGDSYMAAAGLTGEEEDSAIRIVLAALDMIKVVDNRISQMERLGKPSFSMRTGIHTGAVVAGVVGVKKFQYDIWGDTVNTASRMESHGEVGKLNISEVTYELIKSDPRFEFEKRETLHVKGKGELQMYFVKPSDSSL